ncbi:hypothetical protein PTKU64_82870 [Paraburkholderia terrae]|uniref:Uncharacterized protein n=1 Tax=Paraburkholderia terrae TaxID=311230 RepID=A0ABM7U126_9BURK|nr:hypothetical protein PTKU64_82870 [Paraburkholderia terrae]BDC45861.1 hypothetical protein PTKU15_91580 [Paraburkholderia terrae]
MSDADCSGLPVIRYDPDSLHDGFGQAFEMVEHAEESHVTPAGRVQHFIYCHCVKPHLLVLVKFALGYPISINA